MQVGMYELSNYGEENMAEKRLKIRCVLHATHLKPRATYRAPSYMVVGSIGVSVSPRDVTNKSAT